MYVVNWVFARRETDYLASDVLPSPVQHFWSLAVEEQFYVIWPLLLIVLALVVRRPSRRVVALALGALVASSFVWSVWFSHTSPRPAFFTTTTRVWELGIGALLAVALAGRPRPTTPARGSAALGWAALAALVAVALWLPQDIDWPGAWALLPTLPTAALLWVGWQGPARGPVRVLGTAPMVWVGGLSYSIYLWHWPVIILGGWTAEAFGATLPAWGLVAAGARLGRARVAVVAVRRVPDPPRPVAARPAPGPARRRSRPVLRRRARGPAAVRAPLTVHHDAARRHPARRCPSSAPRRCSRASPSPPVDDPGWVTPDPLVAGAGPARGRRRPLPGARRRPPHRSPAPSATRRAAPPSRWSATPRRCSGCRRSRRPRRPGAGGSSPTASRRAPSPTPPRPRRAPPTRECDAWNAAVMDALRADPPDVVVTSGVAASAWTGGGTARAPLVDGLRLALDDPGGCRCAGRRRRRQPGLTRRPRRLRRAAPDRADPLLLRHGIRGRRAAVWRCSATRSPRHPRRAPTCACSTSPPLICPGEQCPVVIGHVAVHRAGDHVTATYAATLAPQVAAGGRGRPARGDLRLRFGWMAP